MGRVPPAREPFQLKTLRKDLGRLVEGGLFDWWILQICESRIFGLRCVRGRCTKPDAPGEEDLVKATRSLIADAIEQIGSRQHRILLTIVFGFDERFTLEDTNLQQRREAAGIHFRDGQRQVKWGTIRQHHEPKGLDLLTEVIAGMERQAAEDGGAMLIDDTSAQSASA
ncbi:MAG TPA: hypothetical protein VF587_16680 [Solirubrobacteraceae bacterium]|jgi:hypothetical protein